MSTTTATWTATDEQFFRITDGMFSAAFVEGATVLLASYDVDSTPLTGSLR